MTSPWCTVWRMTREATVDYWTSDDCEWEAGRLSLDFDNPDIKGGSGNYCATLCVEARQIANDVVVIPARVAEFSAPQWGSIRFAIRELGYAAPLRWFDYPALPFTVERLKSASTIPIPSIAAFSLVNMVE